MNDRERLIELIIGCFDIDENGYYCLNERQKDDIVVEIADHLIANGVVLQKHGKWIIIRDDFDCEFMKCSVCEGEFYDSDNDTVDHLYSYCPDCGSEMSLG